ncbi:hypothetical protein KAR91_65565 [Candidatus Pacearchaeota archaeon]|nr:hypothetical protein [Candidatus Pacearchaeota archaeon]
MFGKDTKELLVQMNATQIEMMTDMKWMKGKLREADSEVGYKRCVQHKAAVDTLAKDVTDVKKSFRWARNLTVTSVIGFVTVGCAAAVKFALGN